MHREILKRINLNMGLVQFAAVDATGRYTHLSIHDSVWEQLGSPDTVTVTVEAGEPKRRGRPPKGA